MRAVVQRVRSASVVANGVTAASIGRGLLVLLGVSHQDQESDVAYVAAKVVALRVFPDERGQMNLPLAAIGGDLLVISQFTLYGDCRKGRRPSYADAAPAEQAEHLYRQFIDRLRGAGQRVVEGVFGAMMDVTLINEGPVTLLVDSRRLF
jgi:D-aminoacyl-tRNA deacylase